MSDARADREHVEEVRDLEIDAAPRKNRVSPAQELEADEQREARERAAQRQERAGEGTKRDDRGPPHLLEIAERDDEKAREQSGDQCKEFVRGERDAWSLLRAGSQDNDAPRTRKARSLRHHDPRDRRGTPSETRCACRSC